MKKFSLRVFSKHNIHIFTVLANNFQIIKNTIYFRDNNSDVVATYPSDITAITEIEDLDFKENNTVKKEHVKLEDFNSILDINRHK